VVKKGGVRIDGEFWRTTHRPGFDIFLESSFASSLRLCAPDRSVAQMGLESQGRSVVYSRVNISMVSLRWGDVLSTLLPGVLALFAIAPYFPLIDGYIKNIDKIGVAGGVALLIVATLAGGVLEAFTRLTWEKLLCRWHPSPNVLDKLSDSQNLELYDRGVQNSYKYVTFYANFAWAIALLFARRLFMGATLWSIAALILGVVFILLLAASYVQWTYFVNYLNKAFKKEL
jgi:hypothetical protein